MTERARAARPLFSLNCRKYLKNSGPPMLRVFQPSPRAGQRGTDCSSFNLAGLIPWSLNVVNKLLEINSVCGAVTVSILDFGGTGSQHVGSIHLLSFLGTQMDVGIACL